MASNKLQVSDFDFDDIKANLKSFLQDQSEFQDYDFEGSGFAVLLDLLAYNTHYLGFNANMLANEMYLDSADIRKNIVSLAKMLGYTPTSPKSPTATIDILMNNIPTTVATITMAKGTAFTTSNKVGRIKDNGNVTVPMATIDSFNFENVTFIKYDIEGYELKALKGSEQTIKKYNPVVVIEQNRGNSHPQELLESWGYTCKGIDKVFNQDYIMVKENV